MKLAGSIEASEDYHYQLAWQPPTSMDFGGYVADPIYIRSTIKFENDYDKKHVKPVPAVQHIQNIETNYGIASQDSVLSDIDFRPAIIPQAQPNTVAEKRTIATITLSLVKFIFNNPLISGLLAIIIGTIILVYFKIIK